MPMPEIFGSLGYLSPELTIDEPLPVSGDAENPLIYEEIVDFFVDRSEPKYVAINRQEGISRPAVKCVPLAPISSSSSVSEASSSPTKSANPGDPIAARRERNRKAAERCRARRMHLIADLQEECAKLRAERHSLIQENRKLLAALANRIELSR